MTTVAPPHSYIDIKDFKSFDDFAKYVVTVSQDDELFASYFWWRKFYRARPCNTRHGMEIACHTYTFTQAYCELCAKLHQDPPERNILTDIHTWWTKSQCKKMKFEK